MPDNTGVVLDTLTGLECSSYNATLSLCQWGGNPVVFPTLGNATAAADDMNNQIGVDRFIGQNPKPR